MKKLSNQYVVKYNKTACDEKSCGCTVMALLDQMDNRVGAAGPMSVGCGTPAGLETIGNLKSCSKSAYSCWT